MNDYCIYLRKSRIDVEAERQGEGETLARHKKALLDLANKRGYHIEKIYEEVVSGETIVSRPQMQALLSDVEQGLYRGVLVMEIERLARGDTMDQGLVAQTFKYSDTLIITPLKIYDPSNEFDEEFFEFGLFMSRREYKTINRRLQRGREASAKEGKFMGSVAPYGYRRKPLADQKGSTLEIVEEKAAVVRLIFDLYINGVDGKRLGIQAIAHRLNELKIPSARNDYWEKSIIRDILSNPVYAGKIRYGYRKVQQKIVDGHKVATRPLQYRDNYILSDGLHEPIISPEIFEQAQQLGDLRPIMPIGYKKEVKNPMAGLVICKLCGRRMSMRRATTPGKPDYLVCHARSCKNVSSPLYMVEERLINSLWDWVRKQEIIYRDKEPHITPQNGALSAAIEAKGKDIKTLEQQLTKAYDLLEQGIYTADVFTERSRSLKERIGETKANIDRLKAEIKKADRQERLKEQIIPHIKNTLEAYKTSETSAKKNELLKEVLDRAIYFKEKSGAFRGYDTDGFELEIFPKLPDE